jgi:hypothetical protein
MRKNNFEIKIIIGAIICLSFLTAKYVCRMNVKTDYSSIMNFRSNEYVEIDYKFVDPQTQTNLAALGGPKEAPYTIKDKRITFQWPKE